MHGSLQYPQFAQKFADPQSLELVWTDLGTFVIVIILKVYISVHYCDHRTQEHVLMTGSLDSDSEIPASTARGKNCLCFYSFETNIVSKLPV